MSTDARPDMPAATASATVIAGARQAWEAARDALRAALAAGAARPAKAELLSLAEASAAAEVLSERQRLAEEREAAARQAQEEARARTEREARRKHVAQLLERRATACQRVLTAALELESALADLHADTLAVQQAEGLDFRPVEGVLHRAMTIVGTALPVGFPAPGRAKREYLGSWVQVERDDLASRLTVPPAEEDGPQRSA